MSSKLFQDDRTLETISLDQDPETIPEGGAIKCLPSSQVYSVMNMTPSKLSRMGKLTPTNIILKWETARRHHQKSNISCCCLLLVLYIIAQVPAKKCTHSGTTIWGERIVGTSRQLGQSARAPLLMGSLLFRMYLWSLCLHSSWWPVLQHAKFASCTRDKASLNFIVYFSSEKSPRRKTQ